MLGELALDGSLRAVAGTLPMLIAAKRAGIPRAIVPLPNRAEAALLPDVETYAVPALADAVAVVLGHGASFRCRGAAVLDDPSAPTSATSPTSADS